ncbi:hypothetical protein MY7_0484 [Bacillus sp. 5B6]|nr:hypothetical protein MY7_0484 [Bacillus sp. 5B6]
MTFFLVRTAEGAGRKRNNFLLFLCFNGFENNSMKTGWQEALVRLG